MSTALAVVLFALCLAAAAPPAASYVDFDFFYLVQQWPGSYCGATNTTCCYPPGGKPAPYFYIHAFSPALNNGTTLYDCDPGSPYDPQEISDSVAIELEKSWPSLSCPPGDEPYWAHEWGAHGTCSLISFDQDTYFQTAVSLYAPVKLLATLQKAGIKPDGGSYSSANITAAIRNGTTLTPVLECNTDSKGNSLLFQVYLCVDKSGVQFIECPAPPKKFDPCPANVKFPPF